MSYDPILHADSPALAVTRALTVYDSVAAQTLSTYFQFQTVKVLTGIIHKKALTELMSAVETAIERLRVLDTAMHERFGSGVNLHLLIRWRYLHGVLDYAYNVRYLNMG